MEKAFRNRFPSKRIGALPSGMHERKRTLALAMATILATLGVALPLEMPEFKEPEPIEAKSETDDAYRYNPLGERIFNEKPFKGKFKFAETVYQATRNTNIKELHSAISQAQLSSEALLKLGEISRELAENFFDEIEKEAAIEAALEALLDSLHRSRSAAGDRPRTNL